MYVDANDTRPPSALIPRPEHRVDMIVGGVLAMFTHIGLPLAIAIGAAVLGAIGMFQDEPARPVVERHVVEARFVKLGRPFDPRRLPDRIVPRLATAVPQGTAVSKTATRRIQPDAGVRQPQAVADVLQRLGDRAQMFAEIRDTLPEVEGSPDGIEDGTDETARAGDLYAGQLYALLRRGWSVPTTLSEEEVQGMRAEVDVTIGQDRYITSFRIHTSSGNPLFDQSILDRLQEIQTNNTQLPEPPAEIAEQYLGQTIGFRFLGRHAR